MTNLLRVAGLGFSCWAIGCSSPGPPSLSGLESFEVKVTDPAPNQLGTPEAPVTFRDLHFDLRAVDSQGQTLARDLDADVFLAYAGNKIGQLTACGDGEDVTPIATVHLAAGVARDVLLHLPQAYGASTLWVQEAPTPTSGQALGASPTFYFANPTIPELQMPLDLTATTATWCSPFNGKHVVVDHATAGGKLIVTSVFPDSFVIADTGASFDDTTGLGGFNHLYVFVYSRPSLEIVPGRLLTQSDASSPALSGNLSKFFGFMELNFPLQSTVDTVDRSLMPPVYSLRASDRQDSLKLLRLTSATVSATGALCPIDPTASDWAKYSQFVLDMNGQCASSGAFTVALPAKTLGGFDPLKLKTGIGAQRFTVVGMLRNNSGQTEQSPLTTCVDDSGCKSFSVQSCVSGTCRKGPYNFWSLVPRDAADVVLCGGTGQACCASPATACDGTLGCSLSDGACH